MKRAVHIILLNEEGELLLQLRDNKPTIGHPGYWGLIGGSANKDETPLKAIKREIKEEIGCKIKNIKLLCHTIFGEYQISIYYGTIKEEIKDINLTEGQKVKYFKFEKIKYLHLVPYLKKLILANKEKLKC